MLVKQTLLFCALIVVGEVRANIYSDFELFQQPIDSWQRNIALRDLEEPVVSGSEQKPVLDPKPHPTTYSPVIPGGIVDVDAGGFQAPPFAEFDVPGLTFNRKPGVFSFGSFFGTDSGQWWKGPNVCIEREESTDDEEDADESVSEESEEQNKTEILKNPLNLFSTSIRFSKCQETANKYECVTRINNHGVVKTFTVRYKCCYGFKRLEGGAGCSKQAELKRLISTLDDLSAKEFKGMISNGNLAERFEEGNYTLFAPTDAALDDYNENIVQMNTVEGQKRKRALPRSLSARDLALSHAVKGFVDLTELSNEDVMYSENNNSSIRVNFYPTPQSYKRLTTVNCARVNKVNNLAENGIVHVMDGVVVMATQTIRQIIADHPQLTSLKRVLDHTDIYTHMKADGHYTVFAPTDDAFNKLDETQKRKILSGGGCASSILKHHITAHTVCSSAIIGNATTHNVEGDTLNLERTADDALLFEGKAKIVDTDIIATDGVIHLIDTVVMPDSALDVANILKTQNLTKFAELIERAGLKEEFANLNNVTVFAPTDKAFERPEYKKMLEEIGDDAERLQEIVKYHTVKGEVGSCDFNNNHKLVTYDNEKELRMNLYSTLPLFTNVVNRATVNCARIGDFDEKACGSVVHEVSGLLTPPTKNLYELLQNDEKYSTLREILKDTEVETILQENNRSITFLAPTDETFAAVDEDFKKDLLQDKKRADEVLKNHILTEVLCCSGVGPKTWGFNNVIPTLLNQHVEVGRVGSKVRINRATVTSCDNIATNGVLHNINKIMVPQRAVNTFGGSFFLFDL